MSAHDKSLFVVVAVSVDLFAVDRGLPHGAAVSPQQDDETDEVQWGLGGDGAQTVGNTAALASDGRGIVERSIAVDDGTHAPDKRGDFDAAVTVEVGLVAENGPVALVVGNGYQPPEDLGWVYIHVRRVERGIRAVAGGTRGTFAARTLVLCNPRTCPSLSSAGMEKWGLERPARQKFLGSFAECVSMLFFFSFFGVCLKNCRLDLLINYRMEIQQKYFQNYRSPSYR